MSAPDDDPPAPIPSPPEKSKDDSSDTKPSGAAVSGARALSDIKASGAGPSDAAAFGARALSNVEGFGVGTSGAMSTAGTSGGTSGAGAMSTAGTSGGTSGAGTSGAMSGAGTSAAAPGADTSGATSTAGTSSGAMSGAGTSGAAVHGEQALSAIKASAIGTPEAGAPPDVSDEAILPDTLGKDALREAVGVTAQRRGSADDHTENPYGKVADHDLEDDEDDDGGGGGGGRRWSRRRTMIAALSIFAGLSTAALIFLGRANAQRYAIVCSSVHVTAEQGRGFPPWGSHPIQGPEWKPIALPSNAECKPRETESLDELGNWYFDLLVDRATTILTARNVLDSKQAPIAGAALANPVDLAAEELDQALLLARHPDRRDQRKEVERLLGDVEYWRASQRLREASTVLLDAAKQFDAAAAQRPRHVSDAAAWASFLRKLTDDLHAGPSGTAAAQFPASAGSSSPATTAPAGVALPIEPAGSDAAGSASVAPPDAGIPSGGVLL